MRKIFFITLLFILVISGLVVSGVAGKAFAVTRPTAVLSFRPFPEPGQPLNPNVTTGTTFTFVAALSNAGSGEIWVMKGDGSSTFPCPSGIYSSGGKNYCKLAAAASTSMEGPYTFSEPGTYTVMANAFSGTTFADGAEAKCTGNPTVPDGWSHCDLTDSGSPVHGSHKTVTVTNAPQPPKPPVPQASLDGTSRPVRVGETLNFKATLSGGSETGAILMAKKPEGKADFYCPSGYVKNGYDVDPEKGKWCQLAEGGGSSKTIAGSFRFLERGEYVVAVNGYASGGYTGTKETGCSGNPFPYGEQGKNAGAWSDCAGNDNITITVLANDPPLCTLVADKGATVKRDEVINFTAYAGNTVGQNDLRIKRMALSYTTPSLPAQQPTSPNIVRWGYLGNMGSVACVPGTNCQASFDTSSLPPEATGFTVACSAFINDAENPFDAFYSPENSCTGHPWAKDATVDVLDSAKDKTWTSTPSEGNPAGGVNWASCGERSNATFKVIPSCKVSGDLNGDLKEMPDEDDFKAWEDAFLSGQSVPAGCGAGIKADLVLFNIWRSKK